MQLQPVNPKFTTLARISVMALHRSIVGFLDSVGMWAQVRSGCGLKSFCGEVISRKIRRCLMRGRRLPSPGMRWCGTRRSRSVVFATPPWKRAALSQPAPLAACTPKPPEERRKALEQKRTNPAGNRRTSQIHYTCMNYWMQMG